MSPVYASFKNLAMLFKGSSLVTIDIQHPIKFHWKLLDYKIRLHMFGFYSIAVVKYLLKCQEVVVILLWHHLVNQTFYLHGKLGGLYTVYM